MTIAVAVASDGARLPLARRDASALAAAVLRAEGVRHAMLSVTFVSTPAIAALNRRHLRRRGATDVIGRFVQLRPLPTVRGGAERVPA